jgi:tripartite-type tricarboxylate transporter receptor subunit TctC
VLGLSTPKRLPAPIVQRLVAFIRESSTKPDVAARLEALRTLARKTPVLGHDFVKIINSQIDTWRAACQSHGQSQNETLTWPAKN